MRYASRMLSMVFAALWVAGCAHDTENLAEATVDKRAKQPRRYLNIPFDTAISPSYSFPKGARWARVDIAHYEYVPVLAIQSFDRERAVAAMETVRTLMVRYRPDVTQP